MSDSFRFAQLVCWVTPACAAGWEWGVGVGLLTFGAQMFSAPPLTRMYIAWRAARGKVDVEDAQRFNLLVNLLCGAAFAVLVRLIIGDQGGVS